MSLLAMPFFAVQLVIMTKTTKLLIFSGLAILIIGLAIGAYFFLRASGDAEEQRDDPGELDREDDPPDEDDSEKQYGDTGELDRENDPSPAITHYENGEIEFEYWYLNGKLIKTNPPSI